MKVHCDRTPDSLRVRAIGVLDAMGARSFRDAIERFEPKDRETVLVDLEQVSFVDSSGLGQLIALSKRTLRHSGRMVLQRPSHEVVRLVRLTRLDRFFEIDAETV